MRENNMSGEIAEYRDLVLQAQKEYLERLKSIPKARQLIDYLNESNDAEELFRMVREKVDQVRTGTLQGRDLDRAELEITVMLAAIQDVTRERWLEKTKYIDYDESER